MGWRIFVGKGISSSTPREGSAYYKKRGFSAITPPGLDPTPPYSVGMVYWAKRMRVPNFSSVALKQPSKSVTTTLLHF